MITRKLLSLIDYKKTLINQTLIINIYTARVFLSRFVYFTFVFFLYLCFWWSKTKIYHFGPKAWRTNKESEKATKIAQCGFWPNGNMDYDCNSILVKYGFLGHHSWIFDHPVILISSVSSSSLNLTFHLAQLFSSNFLVLTSLYSLLRLHYILKWRGKILARIILIKIRPEMYLHKIRWA